MATNRIEVELGISADVSAAKKSISNLEDSLSKLYKKQEQSGFQDLGLNEAVKTAKELEVCLSRALNQKTGKLDISAFQNGLKTAGLSMDQLNQKLLSAGSAGQQVFASLASSIAQAEVPLKRTNKLVSEFTRSIKNVFTYQISASMFQAVTGALSDAVNYTKDLNSSLNDIRIVTGQSSAQMAKFAAEANKSAQKLSTTTNNYTKASLIFYQQGLSDAEVKKRTDAVVKMANVTKESMDDVSSYMTAIWNNFDDGTESLEHYADVMTALGAATASSTKEIAAGLEKFASIGKTIGLSYEYATSAVATIVDKTRQSAETVGTGLRTIFSRLQGLSLGETLEDGVDLNKYSSALKTVGVNILDASGNMKEMDSILDSLAVKWGNLSNAQKTALAQTVGGVRQYTTLISLMDNWDSMKQNINTANTADGSLQNQQDIYAEGWEAAAQRSKAALEGLYQTLLNDKGFIALTDGLTTVTKAVTSLVSAMGGLPGILSTVGMIATKVFSKQITQGVRGATDKLTTWGSQFKNQGFWKSAGQIIRGESQSAAQVKANQAFEAQERSQSATMEYLKNKGKQRSIEYMAAEQAKTLIGRKRKLMENSGRLTEDEQKIAQDKINALGEAQGRRLALRQEKEQQSVEFSKLEDNAISEFLAINTSQGKKKRKGQKKNQTPDQHLEDLYNLAGLTGTGAFQVGAGKNNSQARRNNLQGMITTSRDSARYQALADDYLGMIQKGALADPDQRKSTIKEINAAFGKDILAEDADLDAVETKLQEISQQAAEARAAMDDLIKISDTDSADQKNAKKKIKELLDKAGDQGSELASRDKEEGYVTGQIKGFEEDIDGILNGEQLGDKLAAGLEKATATVGGLITGFTQAKSAMEVLGDTSASIGDQISAGMSMASGAVTAFATGGPWAAVAYLVGVVGSIAVDALIKQFNAAEIAAQKAEAVSASLSAAADEAANRFNALSSAISGYDSAIEVLNNCTKGTQEWNEALQNVHTSISELLTDFPELMNQKDLFNSDGTLNKTILDQALEEAKLAAVAADAAALQGRIEAEQARIKADTVRIQRDFTGQYFVQTGISDSGNMPTGYWEDYNLAYSDNNKYTRTFSGDLNRVVDSYSFMEDGEVLELIDVYEALGVEMGDNSTIAKDYANSLLEQANRTIKATTMIDNATKSIITSWSNNKGVDLVTGQAEFMEAAYTKAVNTFSNAVEAANKKNSKTHNKDHSILGEAFDKTSFKNMSITQAFNHARGTNYQLASNGVRGVDGNRTYVYLENGEEKTYTLKEMQTAIAAAAALEQMGDAAAKAKEKIANISENLAGSDATDEEKVKAQTQEVGLQNYLANKNLESMTESDFKTMQDTVESMGGASAYLQQAFGMTEEEITNAFGENFITNFANTLTKTGDAWKDAWGNNKDVAIEALGEVTKEMSLSNVAKLSNYMDEFSLGPAGAEAGAQFVEGLNKMIEDIDPEQQQAALTDLLTTVDWTSYDAFDQAQVILKKYGITINETDAYWKDFVADMRLASGAMPDFSKIKTDLNSVSAIVKDLKFGDIVDEEDYQTLIAYNDEWERFFLLQADGSRQFVGNAEDFNKFIQEKTIANREEIDLRRTVSELEGIGDVKWSEGGDAAKEAFEKYMQDDSFKALMEKMGYTSDMIGSMTAEQLKEMYTRIGEAVNANQIELDQSEFEQMIASMATSFTDLDALYKDGTISANTYSRALLSMASGYEYCSSAAEAYVKAIGTDREDEARAALEAAIQAEEAASKLETAYSNAMSGKSSMTVEDLNALKEGNEELYNSFLTMSDNDWYEAAYQAQRELLNQRLATYGEETAEYKAALVERQQLDEDYLEAKKEKQKEIFEGFIENWETENDKIQTAVDALDIFSDGTAWGEQSFEAIETLRQALLDTGKTAEEVDAILKNLGKDEEMTDVETLWAATREKAKLLLEQAGNSQQAAAQLGIDASTELIITDAKSTTPKVEENEAGDGFKANVTGADLPVKLTDDSGTKTSGAAVLWDANGAYVNVKDPTGKPIKVYIDDDGAVFDKGVIVPLGDGTYGIKWSATVNQAFTGSVGGSVSNSATTIGLQRYGDGWKVTFGTASQTFTGTVDSSDLTGGKLFFDTADNKWKVQWGDGTTKDFTAYLKAAPGKEDPFTTYFEKDPKGEGWVLKLKNANGEEITLTLNADALNKDKLATSHPYLDMTDEGLVIKTKEGFLTVTPNIDFTNSNFGIDKDGNLTFNGAVLPLNENGAIDFSQFVSDGGGSLSEVVKATGIYKDYTPTIWEEILSFGLDSNPFDIIQNEYDGDFLRYLEDRGDYSIDGSLTDLIEKSRDVLLNTDSYDANEIALAKAVFEGMGMATVSRHQNPFSSTVGEYIGNRALTEDDLKEYRSNFIKSAMMDLEKITGYNFSADLVIPNYGSGYVFESEDHWLNEKNETPFQLSTNANLNWMSNQGYDEFIRQYFDGMLSEIMVWGNEDGTNEYFDAIQIALKEAINSSDKQVQQQGYFIAQGLLEAASRGLKEDDPILQALEQLIADMNETLEINSPSRLTMEMGKWLALGLQEGAVGTDIDLSPLAEKALTSIKNYLAEHKKDLSLDELLPGITQDALNKEYQDALSSGTTTAADINAYAKEKGYAFNKEANQWQLTQEGKKNYLAAQGANIQTTSGGKSYITNKDGKVISGLYDTIDEAILAGYQTLYSEEAMTKYFTGKIDNKDEFLSYMEDDSLTAIQKGMMTSVIQGAVDAANKEGNLSTYVTSWEELIAAVGFDKAMEYLEASYGDTSVQFLNDIKSVWAEYSDLVVQSVQTHVDIEDKAAQKVVDIWKNAFTAILKAKQAMIDEESFASVLSEEEIKSFVELYARSGKKSAADIRNEMFKTSGQSLPEFNVPYNSADSRSFTDSLLTYDNTTGYVTSTPLATDPKTGEFVIPTGSESGYQQFKTNLTNEVTSMIQAGMTDKTTGELWDFTKLFANKEFQDALMSGNMDNAFTAAQALFPSITREIVELLAGTATEVKDKTTGKVTGHQIAENVSVADFTQAYINKTYPDLPQTYQDAVVGRITADIGQINTLKTNLTTQGDNFINARQSEVDLVDKARGLLAANESLAENLTLAEQKTLKELTGKSDLAAISLGDLGTATTRLSGIMETASSDLEVAMGMLERGEATGFTINSDGTVSVSKTMSYATAAASNQTISTEDTTAALAAAQAAREAAEKAYREANPLKEDASDADKTAYNKAVTEAGTAAYNETLDNFNVTVNITLNGEGVYVSDTVTNAGNATATATAQANETYATAAGFTDAAEMNDYIAMMETAGNDTDNYSDGGMLTAQEMMDQSAEDGIDTLEKAIEKQREYAKQLKAMEEGLNELNSSGKAWIKTLKSENASFDAQAKALGNLRKSYQKVLGLTNEQMRLLGDGFLKDEKNLDLVTKAATKAGKEGAEALNELQVAAAKAIDPFGELDTSMDSIITKLSNLKLDAGALLTGGDAADAEAYWDAIVNKAISSGKSLVEAVEMANGALNSVGKDVEPQFDIVTENVSAETWDAAVKQTGTTDMVITDPISGAKTKVTSENYGSFLETHGGSIPITYIKGKGGKGLNASEVTGRTNNYRQRAEKTGGGGGGGGGGGSRRRYLAKAKPEDHKERYHEIDNAIDDVVDALERLNKQQDRAWGADRLKSMKEESAELKNQADLIHDKITEAEAYLDTDLDAALKAGWTFDEDGNVSNYEDHWNYLLEGYNNAIEEYNNMSIAEQEAIDKKFEEANDKYYEAKAKGDKKGMEEWGKYINPETEVAFGSYEEYLKYTMLDAPTEALEQYEETKELLEDLGLEMVDVLNSWYDNVLEQIQYKLDLALELTENELNIIDYKLKSIEDNAYRAGEALGLMTQKMDASKANFNAYYTALDDLLKANNADWSADKLLSGEITAEDLADAGLQSGDIDIIKTVMEGLRESTAAMTEQMVEGYETMTDSFESFNEELQRYISTIEHAQNVTSTYKNILDLTGRSMSGFTSTMLKELNTLVVEQAQHKLSSNKTTLDTVKKEFETAQAAYKKAQEDFAAGSIDQAALDAAKEAYESAQDNLDEAEENFLTSWEETLQAAADAFESNIEEITRTIGEALSGGLAGGLAELEDQFAKMQEQDNIYVDDYEKIYQLTKLTRDLESKMDNTTNIRAQKEMLKLQEEINGLLESDQKLSQYDIEYLQKKADLKLAEIAMQEAQDAKSQVMMRRDSEGNYNYVYTADEDAVEQAEQEYADKLYEMQVANDEYITSLQESMASLSSQMLNEIASIDRTIYDTEEKYQAEVERITNHYSIMMDSYNSEMKKVLNNNTILYNEDWTEYNKYTGYKISAAKDYVTEWNQTMLSQVTGFDNQEDFYANFNKTLYGDNPESPSSDSLIGQVLTAYSTMTQQIAAANAAAGLESGTLADLVMDGIEEATEAANTAATNIATQAGLITTAITGIGTAINQMATNYAKDFKTMSDATDVLNRRLSDFLTMAGSSQEFSIDAGILSQIRARLDAEGFDTGGYTGAWGSEGKLAFLHQKELVLNAEDTANMLASVGILRQIANVIDLNALTSAGGFISLMSSGVRDNKETLQQEVHIEAHFPNATDKNQIEDAFKDIVNLAAQYANRSSF